MPEPEGSSNSDDTVMDAGPAHVVEAPPADPMALDNFRLSDAVKQQLRAKKIESLFPIQAGQQMPSVLDALHTGSACTSAGHARVQDEILGTMHVRKGPPLTAETISFVQSLCHDLQLACYVFGCWSRLPAVTLPPCSSLFP